MEPTEAINGELPAEYDNEFLDPDSVDFGDISVVPEPTEKLLDERTLLDYRHHRKRLLAWALTCGKNPKDGEGFAHTTMHTRANCIDQFYRWVWGRVDRYTTHVTHEQADAFCKKLAYGDDSQSHKLNMHQSLKVLFRWREEEFDEDEWNPERTFSQPNTSARARDYLTIDERRRLREAILDYRTIPHYSSVTPDERQRWKAYLAQRYQIPTDEVTLDHWKEETSWKYISLVWASLDCGLRPIEVERALTSWVYPKRQQMTIPAMDSKNDIHWQSVIQARTADAMDLWLTEREHIAKYDDTDALWLTEKGNRYDSQALSRLMDSFCEAADIDTSNRSVTWYSLRRGLATAMIDKGDLSTAQTQMRHLDPKSTMRYDQAPEERRRRVLDKLG